jgi:hypothetical protein
MCVPRPAQFQQHARAPSGGARRKNHRAVRSPRKPCSALLDASYPFGRWVAFQSE